MYKNKKQLVKSKRFLNWLKIKSIVIISALMLGMSNSLKDEDNSIFYCQYKIEQKDKKE
jgi:hypothetical protein